MRNFTKFDITGENPAIVRHRPSTRRAKSVAVIFVFCLLLNPGRLWPWGPFGHRVSALLAESRLSPAALGAVHKLLAPGRSLADVATWADEQQEVPQSGAWHYVNVPISEPRYDPRFCSPEGCVASKIDDFRHVLRDPRASRRSKQRALKFLIHLIQDIHQPMHVGDTESRGGNLLQVRFFGVGSNLHKVWDSQIIEWHGSDEAVWLAELNAIATPAVAQSWSRGSVEDWASESLEEARLAYRLPGNDKPMKPGARLGSKYCRFALPIIQKRLAQAGIRIASVLNEVFG